MDTMVKTPVEGRWFGGRDGGPPGGRALPLRTGPSEQGQQAYDSKDADGPSALRQQANDSKDADGSSATLPPSGKGP